MTKKQRYTIERVAEELGISKSTILRYEKKGIFPRSKRNPINKWRQYTEEDVRRLKRICEGEG
ncbi:MAG: MerR family transcriptional regulator [Candidatus Omnitrophica bacterium]|nr:MerR family transcriptional regulator [Candidatus Omnitrophota bacterium]